MGKIISLATKKQVLKMFQQGLRSKKISNVLNLDRSTVKEWQYLFDGGDTRWVSENPIERVYRFSEFQRSFIVRAYLTNALTMADLCRTFTVPKTVIKHWVRTTRKDGAYHCDTNSETDKRARKRGQILEDLFQSSRRERDRPSKKKIIQVVERGKETGLSVSFMLKVIGVSRSDYYYWVKHLDRDEHNLVERIRAIQKKKDWNIGSKRMAQLLREDKDNPIVINHKKVARIMTENNLHAKQKIRKHPKDYYRQKKEKARHLPENILDRDFHSDKPNKKLLTDISYLHIRTGWCFLSAVKDVYNGEIVAYAMSQCMNLKLVIDTIMNLKTNIGSLRGVLLHSDRGWTYTNPQFVKLLKSEGMKQSLSRKGNCWDNAPMESFFSTFKSETIHHDDLNYRHFTYSEMVLLVENYISYYNNVRIVKKLGWISPVQYRIFNT